MSEPGFCLTFSEKEARAVFKRVSAARVVLAVLAGVSPEAGWDGCAVFLGGAQNGEGDVIAVGVTGVAAEAVTQALAEALERMGVTARRGGPGAPPLKAELARVVGGQWQSA